MYPIHKYTMLILLLFLLPLSASALDSDKNEKIFIVADSTLYNYKSGVKVFEGHVKVDQGSTHITANKLVTKDNNLHKIQEAIAYGFTENAHYWTTPNAGEPEMHAYAKVIKFYPQASNVTLERDVTIKQAENSFQGHLIIYNRSEQTIIVPASKDGRAVLVYNPEK